MNCQECGFEVQPIENFCGNCGARIEVQDDRYDVYNYNKRIAKDNKAYFTYGHIFPFSFLLSIPAIIGAMVLGFSYDSMTPAARGIFFCVFMAAFITFIIVASIRIATYIHAPLRSIVKNKQNGNLYLVHFNIDGSYGWDTASRVAAAAANAQKADEMAKQAQKDNLCIQVVEDYLNGRNQPTAMQKFWTGYPVKIFDLSESEVIAKKKRYTQLRYRKPNGKYKKIKVANSYNYDWSVK